MREPCGERIVLVASNYGGARHPAWYHNLRANPRVRITEGGRTVSCLAREATGPERDRLWRAAVAFYTGWISYQRRAGSRRIPIIVLEPLEP